MNFKNAIRRWLALLAGCATAVCAQPVSFGLFGDTPYSDWERERLPDLMGHMAREDLAFVVHVGDIKSGGSVCSDALFKDIRDVFQASVLPVVYLPGDNEWTDCYRRSNGRYDPLERLNKLRELFFLDEYALGHGRLALSRQSADPAFAPYRENVRWEAGGVLFVGLHVTGSDNNFHGRTRAGGPVPEFVQRGAANRAWLAQAFEHARRQKLPGIMLMMQGNPRFDDFNAGRAHPGYQDFLTQLRDETRRFQGQVVLVHGDTHWHRVDQPLRDPATHAAMRNFTRVETFGYPFFGWVRASVDVNDPQVFRFMPRPWSSQTSPN